MQHLFFTIEPEYRDALRELGRDLPAIAEVLLDLSLLPAGQRTGVSKLLSIENKFLVDDGQGLPAHDSRTLLLALTRQAWADPMGLRDNWTLEKSCPARTAIPRAFGPGKFFEPAEWRGLVQAYAAQAEGVLTVELDVDERVYLLLMLELAEAHTGLSVTEGYQLQELLNKLLTLSLPEADILWRQVQAASEQLQNSATPSRTIPLPLWVPSRQQKLAS